MLRSARFIISTSVLYAATLSVIGYAFVPDSPQQTRSNSNQQPSPPAPSTPRPAVISGTPTHIAIPSHNIDLQVQPGHYDSTSNTWTLSDTQAHYATLTPLINDTAGATLIYGHATDAVFGKLAALHPTVDTTARVTTTDGTIFSYTFTHSETLSPDDTSLFDDVTTGPPRLVLQTCTGIWSEWRTMYYFDFEGVARP